LSRIEAGYFEMSDKIKEIRFINILLKSIGSNIKLSIVARSNDICAIFMGENSSSGVRTSHEDTRYHFIR
jgi:hypothetical protein